MAYPNPHTRRSLVLFFPFCSNDFYELMEQCVGCDFAEQVGLAAVVNGSLQFFSGKNSCNPHVYEYPLPLYKCGVCNQGVLNFVVVYMFLVAILSVLGNGWSLAVWLKQGTKRSQTIFKLSLTLSDFVFGLFVLPSTIASIIDTMYMPHEEYYDFSTYTNRNASVDLYETNWEALFISSHTDFTGFILYLTQGASLCTILLLTIDTHLAITRQIKYYQNAARRKLIVTVILVWLLVAGAGLVIKLTMSFFVVKPSALFLPIVESDDKLLITSALVYLIPLSVVFLTCCTVALMTSRKLYKLSRSSGNCGLSKSSSWYNGLTNWRGTRGEIARQSTKSKRLKSVRKKKAESIVLTGVNKTIDRNITETQIDDAQRHQKSNNRSQASVDRSQAEEQHDVSGKPSPLSLTRSLEEELPIKRLGTESKTRTQRKHGLSASIYTTVSKYFFLQYAKCNRSVVYQNWFRRLNLKNLKKLSFITKIKLLNN